MPNECALNQHQIRIFFHQHRLERRDDARRRFKQALARPHAVEIIVRQDREGLERLIEKAAMLGRHCYPRFEFVGSLAEPPHHRRQLDRLGPRAQNEKDFHVGAGHLFASGTGRVPLGSAAAATYMFHTIRSPQYHVSTVWQRSRA